MAATGYTPIILYSSTTAAAVPVTANLAAGELALNITDGKLYFNKSGVITVLANSNSIFATAVTTFSAGTTGFTPSSATSGAVTLAGTLIVGNGGTGATTLTGVLKGNGTSAFTAATAGTDYVAPGTATTFTALQTFTGSTTVAALKTTNMKEVATVSATAATGTVAFYVTTQSVLYYTTDASGNWTINLTGSSTPTTLNNIMAVGESMSVTFLVTIGSGSPSYYNSVVQVDGTATGVTTKWQGGTAPTTGNASSVDSYTYVIIKTAATPTYTVLASQTKFA
jgi:hypothetical protein